MLNFRDCSIEDFTKAMNFKNNTLAEIETKYLYILYTKYRSDSSNFNISSDYALSIYLSIKNKRDLYEAELKRRNVF